MSLDLYIGISYITGFLMGAFSVLVGFWTYR
jgi:hypothetical protein